MNYFENLENELRENYPAENRPASFEKDLSGVTYGFELSAEQKAEVAAKRESEFARYQSEYPDCTVTPCFLLEIGRAARDMRPCENCTGVPCGKKSNPGIKYKVTQLYGFLYVTAYECAQYKRAKVDEKIKRQFRRAKIPALYAGKNFVDYQVDEFNKNAVNWARYLLEHPQEIWLYFHGAPGTGKTFLASIIAQGFLNQGETVIFEDVPQLLNDLRKTFAKESEDNIDELMETLTQADVLVLDDLGTETSTQWAIERLYLIINSRYNAGKLTVVTSNYDLNEMAAKLNAPKDGKPGVTGDRICSRLRGKCKVARLGGKDRRLK